MLSIRAISRSCWVGLPNLGSRLQEALHDPHVSACPPQGRAGVRTLPAPLATSAPLSRRSSTTSRCWPSTAAWRWADVPFLPLQRAVPGRIDEGRRSQARPGRWRRNPSQEARIEAMRLLVCVLRHAGTRRGRSRRSRDFRSKPPGLSAVLGAEPNFRPTSAPWVIRSPDDFHVTTYHGSANCRAPSPSQLIDVRTGPDQRLYELRIPTPCRPPAARCRNSRR